jgi:hypothetical protein
MFKPFSPLQTPGMALYQKNAEIVDTTTPASSTGVQINWG